MEFLFQQWENNRKQETQTNKIITNCDSCYKESVWKEGSSLLATGVQKGSFIWKSVGDPAPRISDMKNMLFHKQEGKLAEAGDRMRYLAHLIFF